MWCFVLSLQLWCFSTISGQAVCWKAPRKKWEYDDKNHIVKLVGLIALYPACHEVKHIGLAEVRGNLVRATADFMKVNGMTLDQAKTAMTEAVDTFERRSE